MKTEDRRQFVPHFCLLPFAFASVAQCSDPGRKARCLLRRAWLLVVNLLIPVHAAAQAAAPPPPPPRHEGTAEVAFVGVTGNASTSTFSAGGEYITRPTSW